jgi:hypothetical protein
MKKVRIGIALILAFSLSMVLLIGSASAICQHKTFKVNYNNYRYCEWGCGFLNIYRQNVWNETVTYNCTNGPAEYSYNTNVRNGQCC